MEQSCLRISCVCADQLQPMVTLVNRQHSLVPASALAVCLFQDPQHVYIAVSTTSDLDVLVWLWGRPLCFVLQFASYDG
jgi:hypothetical protein